MRRLQVDADALPQALKDALEKIKSDGVEFLLLWFTDIEGHLKSFAITPYELEGALDAERDAREFHAADEEAFADHVVED